MESGFRFEAGGGGEVGFGEGGEGGGCGGVLCHFCEVVGGSRLGVEGAGGEDVGPHRSLRFKQGSEQWEGFKLVIKMKYYVP